MAGALMPRGFSPLRRPLRPVNAGRGILLQGHHAVPLAPLKRLLGGAQLRLDTPLHVAIPASGEEQTRASRDEDEEWRHHLEPETRPERARFDRRDEIGGKAARRQA
jgi:hypothetical protein